MSKQILVPLHVAEREATERANREVAVSKLRHADDIEELRRMLKRLCDVSMSDRDDRQKVYSFCHTLINYSRFSPLQLTPKEIGFLVSDVLLGDGVGYEEKT